MDRIAIIIVSILLGLGAGYAVTQYFAENTEVRAQAVITEPQKILRLETTEVYAQNTVIAIRENKTLGRENNAAMMKQWASTAQIGVNFTGFDWNSLTGMGQPIPEVGTVTVSGTLPALEILNNFSVTGAEEDIVISRNRAFDEEAELGPLLESQKITLMDCIAAQALYRQKTLDDARDGIHSLMSAALPRRADGTLPVVFSLTFANEQELTDAIAQRSARPESCESKVMY